jgi:hypothetical protein
VAIPTFLESRNMSNKKKYLTLVFLISLSLIRIHAQNEGNIWLLGSYFTATQPDDLNDSIGGGTSVDFNYEPIKIYRDKKRLNAVAGGNASICDKDGKLLAWCNGQTIMDGQNEYIVDTINYDSDLFPEYCREWQRTDYNNDTISLTDGLLGMQRVIILPLDDSVYCVVYNSVDFCDLIRMRGPKYTMIKRKANGYDVLKIDEAYRHPEFLSSPMYTVRHGNGRDWWLLVGNDDYKAIITFLVDINGINFHAKSNALMIGNHYGEIGQISASMDGNYIGWNMSTGNEATNGGGFNFGRFDRCTGEIFDIKGTYFPWTLLGLGVSFSTDNKYIYACNTNTIYQYPLDATDLKASEKVVAEYDGFQYWPKAINSFGHDVNFNLMQMGIDGRIYIFPTSADNRYFSVINHSNEEGLACDVVQHAFRAKTSFSRTVPNIPNFRLGPLDGSACDTLGLDNHPIAKYRYEPDTIEYKRIRFTDLSYFRPETWSWDFGDGSPKISQRSPYHSYAQNGTYKVCLTVSNENSTNTSCRNITIGTSATDDNKPNLIDVNIFPNPVQDFLLVTIGEYIPAHAHIEFYSSLGQQIHRQRVYYGHNNVDMTTLPSGTYGWLIVDRGVVVKSGEVVKL